MDEDKKEEPREILREVGEGSKQGRSRTRRIRLRKDEEGKKSEVDIKGKAGRGEEEKEDEGVLLRRRSLRRMRKTRRRKMSSARRRGGGGQRKEGGASLRRMNPCYLCKLDSHSFAGRALTRAFIHLLFTFEHQEFRLGVVCRLADHRHSLGHVYECLGSMYVGRVV